MYRVRLKCLGFIIFCLLSGISFPINNFFQYILKENIPYSFEIKISSMQEKPENFQIDDIKTISSLCKTTSNVSLTITPLSGVTDKNIEYILFRVEVGTIENTENLQPFDNLKQISQKTFNINTYRDLSIHSVECIKYQDIQKDKKLSEAICADLFTQIFRLNNPNILFIYKDKPDNNTRTILPIRKDSTIIIFVIIDEEKIKDDLKEYDYQMSIKHMLTPFDIQKTNIIGNIILSNNMIIEERKFLSIKKTGLIDREELYFIHIKRIH